MSKATDNSQKVHPQHRQPLQLEQPEDADVWNARGDQQDVNRQPGGTAHEWRHEDGHQPVLRTLDGACGHDPRNGAREGAEHGNEALAMQPHLAHQPVHQKRSSGHVPCVLKQANEQEQQQDLRQENHHRPHPGHHSVD
jgi:hypothetical protein